MHGNIKGNESKRTRTRTQYNRIDLNATLLITNANNHQHNNVFEIQFRIFHNLINLKPSVSFHLNSLHLLQ